MQVSRRQLLQWGGLGVLAVPLAGCDGGYSDTPDPLSALAAAARSDAAAAGKLGGSAGQQVAVLRAAHARALERETSRANRPAAPAPRAPAGDNPAALGKRLAAAQRSATGQLATTARHRAGLLASVAAGCAGGVVLDPGFGKPAAARFPTPELDGELEQPAVDAVQQALDAEHAALWVFRQVTAFLPGGYDEGLQAAGAEHTARRDATARLLTAAGAAPRLAETGYLTPRPVANAGTARAAVLAAETDAAVAWRGVVERCDEPALRRFAAAAMAASAVRITRWRKDAGAKPAAVALPGTP